MNKNDCRFCDIWNGVYAHAAFDKPIFKKDNYMSIVSVGAFVEGWSLVVPHEHVYSMRSFYAQKDFLSFVATVAKHVREVYNKPVIIFEHGANCCDSATSCGTHHAHLHVVPYSKSLLQRILNDRDWVKVSYNKIQEVVGGEEYLLYSDLNETIEDSDIYIHILKNAESQYFRRIIAEDTGILDYSYKTAPYTEETIKSYETLKVID